jgi:heme/copper-type cytochrome/quinol oxidase subunit 3
MLWLVAGGLASFLMLRYSAPLGRLIPKLEIGVFSWRMLGLSSFAVGFTGGACWHAAQAQSSGKQRWLPALGAVAILLAAVCVSFQLVIWPMVRSEAFRPNPAHYNYATLPAHVFREGSAYTGSAVC